MSGIVDEYNEWLKTKKRAKGRLKKNNTPPPADTVVIDASSGANYEYIWHDGSPGERIYPLAEPKPDIDGYITFEEARNWWRYGNGVSLHVDLGKLDLSKIRVSDFPDGVGSEEYINLASPRYLANMNDALVYGTIKLTYLGGKRVKATIGYDYYDFDMHNWESLGTALRNVETMIDYSIHKFKLYPVFPYIWRVYQGDSYYIYLDGEGIIG
jgi:hypothetical protein